MASAAGLAALLSGAIFVFCQGRAARAQTPESLTLEDSLRAAHATSPALEAARAAAEAAAEQRPLSYTGFLPRIDGTLNAGVAEVDSTSAFFQSQESRSPRAAELKIEQPVFSGGATLANVTRGDNLALAGREAFRQTEQDILLRAASGFFNLQRDTALATLARDNEKVLAKRFEETRARYQVGENTRTDVAQARARLAQARAGRVQSEGALAQARAAYANVTGIRDIKPLATPPRLGVLPPTLEEGVALARAQNPAGRRALHDSLAADAQVSFIFRSFFPSLTLKGNARRAFDSVNRGSRNDSLEVRAELYIPLFRSGESLARISEAKHNAREKEALYRQALRDAESEARNAWHALAAARAAGRAFEAQRKANALALEGVQSEEEAGDRTVLDILNAEQELSRSRAMHTEAQRDLHVARFRLLAATGQLTPESLGLAAP